MKMVLQVILRRKNTYSVKMFSWTELKTLQRITERTLKSFAHNLANQKIEFSWPDLAFGFVNNTSGYEIINKHGFKRGLQLQRITQEHALSYSECSCYLPCLVI